MSVLPPPRARRRLVRPRRDLSVMGLWCAILLALTLLFPLLTDNVSAQGTTFRINSAGSAFTDGSGQAWSADTGFSGGSTWSRSVAIANTNDDTLYQSLRFGNFSYNLGVSNGTYQVTLKFAELYYSSAGRRVFNVIIEGQTVLSNFDIMTQAGMNTAVDRTFTATVSDGTLNIVFASVIDNAQVNAIAVVPVSGGTTRVNTGGGAFTDGGGRTWSADYGFSGGATYGNGNAIANTGDDALYQNLRFGNFSYNLGVPNGSYQVTLKFAEIYYTSAGRRVFNVTVEGQPMLSNFDIVGLAGANAALDRVMTTNVSDGMLNIVFTSLIDNAQVNAIEVIPSGAPAPTPTPSGPAPTPTPQGAAPAVMWGAYLTGTPWNMSVQDQFETMLNKRASIMPLGIYWQQNGQYYTFGSQGYFPTQTMEAIRQRGSIPLLAWGASDSAYGENQPNFRNAVVANGTHDTYIRQFARQAKAWGKPFFIKLNWEMNGYWAWPWMEKLNGNQPGDFVRSWRRVVDIFRQEGANNVTWVWCPNVIDGWTTPLSQVYPGDGYVDWSCMHGYNWGQDWYTSFTGLMTGFPQKPLNTYQGVLGVAPSKPMMLGEWASDEENDNGATKAAWIRDALDVQIPRNFPKVRAVVWFSTPDQGERWPIDSTTASRDAFRGSIASSVYKANNFGSLWTSPIPPPTQ